MFAGMFGIFGHGNVSGIGQALEEVGGDLTYYRPQNEQAMVHTSIAYARMKNRLQMMACTSSVGPGALNMVTGAATATVNRLPVLLLPGDTFANRVPHPVLQQLEYQLGTGCLGQRLLPAGFEVLRPHSAAGAAPFERAGSDAGAGRSG